LLAISGRKVLVEAVTDVLVERGNQRVVSRTAKNGGARFSEFGVSTLVKKACDDGDLALCVWSRPDIPRQNLIKLFVEASEAVKSQLAEADPRRAELIKSMVAKASDEIQTKARAGSHEYAQAQSLLSELHATGKLETHFKMFLGTTPLGWVRGCGSRVPARKCSTPVQRTQSQVLHLAVASAS